VLFQNGGIAITERGPFLGGLCDREDRGPVLRHPHWRGWLDRWRLKSLRSLIARLTPRDREVFKLVVRGKMNKQIAFELGASQSPNGSDSWLMKPGIKLASHLNEHAALFTDLPTRQHRSWRSAKSNQALAIASNLPLSLVELAL
jgi:hypothetical protein